MKIPVAAMKTSTSPTVSPVQRCKESTRLCITARRHFVRAGTISAGMTALLACIAAPQRRVDESVGPGLLDLHLAVPGIELGEDAALLLCGAGRHPSIAGEHGDLFFERIQESDAIGPADRRRDDREDFFGSVRVDEPERPHESVRQPL